MKGKRTAVLSILAVFLVLSTAFLLMQMTWADDCDGNKCRTPTPTVTRTKEPTRTMTPSQTATGTPTKTPTLTFTPTPSPSTTPTDTVTPTPTDTPTPTESATSTPTATATPVVEMITSKTAEVYRDSPVTPSPGKVQSGDRIVYNVAITNTGQTDGLGLVISDTIPADTTYVPGSAVSNGALYVGNSLVATMDTLQSGSVFTLTFSVIVNPPPLGAEIDNLAVVRAQNFDPDDPSITLVVELPVTPTPTPTPACPPGVLCVKTYLPVAAKDACGPWPVNYAVIIGTSGSASYLLRGDGQPAIDGAKALGRWLVGVSPNGRDRLLIIAAGGKYWSYEIRIDTSDPLVAQAAIDGMAIVWQSSTLAGSLNAALDRGVRQVVLIDDMWDYLDPSGADAQVLRAANLGVKIYPVVTDALDPVDPGYYPNYDFAWRAANATGGVGYVMLNVSDAEWLGREIAKKIYCWQEVPGASGPSADLSHPELLLVQPIVVPASVTTPKPVRLGR